MTQMNAERPIYFFEVYLNENGIKLLKQKFYNAYIEDDNVSCSIDKDDESVTYYLNGIGEGGESVDGWETKHFRDYLERKLRIEFRKSKTLIYNKIIQIKTEQKSITEYLNWLINSLITIKKDHQSILEKYPICNCPIDGLMNYINKQLEIDKIDPAGVILEKAIEENLVLAIFGFLKGNNHDGQKIMSDSDFDRLIKEIQKMVDNEEFVPVEKADKIPKLNIPNDLLRYCFYILHKKKYGIRPQKKYFIDFMHKNLVQFESVGYTTLKTAFSSKPHSRDDNYIPDIIKRECKTSRNC